MTYEEIEKALRSLVSIELTNPRNYDSCGRLIIPKYNDIIHAALDYINRLKAENESKENCTIEQHAEIHRLRDELRRVSQENENMHGELMSLQAYIDNHEEIWKHNAEIEKMGVNMDTEEHREAIAHLECDCDA